jgi:hypothetical protein
MRGYAAEVGRLLAAALVAIAVAASLSVPAIAAGPRATDTASLVPGPPVGSWTDSPDETGPITASDFYGSGTTSPPGYVDGYGRGWTATNVDLEDDPFHLHRDTCPARRAHLT